MNGGTKGQQRHAHLQLRSVAERQQVRRLLSVNWTNSRVTRRNSFATVNPSFQTNLLAAYTQPILRGFKIDNTRQQLLININNQGHLGSRTPKAHGRTDAGERAATHFWDLVFAQSSVDVAQRALELADKLVEDNQARVEVGTLAPLDIVQAQAEAATRRQNLAAAEATAQTAELALKRYHRQRHRRPDVAPDAAPGRPARSGRRRPTVERRVRTALAERTDIINAREEPRLERRHIKYLQNQSLPALDLNASYGAQGSAARSSCAAARHRQPVTARSRAAISTHCRR
jgi:outer membrane protein TolC